GTIGSTGVFKNLFLISCAVLVISGLPYYARDISAIVSRDAGPGTAAQAPAVNLANPADAKPVAHYATGVRAAIVPMSRAGHFAADFRINGRNVRGLIDTGATYVAINSSTARHLGLSLAGSDFRHQVRTANGATSAAMVKLDRIQIGSISVDD